MLSMEKIFYMDKSAYPSTTEAAQDILKSYFQIPDAKILRSESGKPYLDNSTARIFFSPSHTKTGLFIAFSSENVGLDAEQIDREVHYSLLLKRFPFEERAEIISAQDFLRHWTAKESAVKWLGGTLSHDLKKIGFIKDVLSYDGLEIPVHLTFKELEGHLLAICSERDFTNATVIKL